MNEVQALKEASDFLAGAARNIRDCWTGEEAAKDKALECVLLANQLIETELRRIKSD